MATAVVQRSVLPSGKSSFQEERRWGSIGTCLAKILTPALRNVLGNELPIWYQSLTKPPCNIDKQTSENYITCLLPSTMKLNYKNINNNAAHKSPKSYDYAVRDPMSLAKLFVKPFMVNFTGFNNTMDISAALSVMSEAKPFISSGAACLAKKIKSDIRNKWAHCDFSHWTDANFQTALNDMQSLVEILSLDSTEKKVALDELDKGRKNRTEMDCKILDLVWTEVEKFVDEDSKIDKKKLFSCLQSLKVSLNVESRNPYVKETLAEENFNLLKKQHGSIYVFQAPRKNPLFGGRQSELQELEHLLGLCDSSKPVNIVAICGLGGVGKTSLATEYAHQKKDYYTGGVFWISGEDSTAFENSVNDIAAHFRTLSNSFAITLSTTLTEISQQRKPWLMILDNMDELDISPNIVKLVSGHWQNGACGSLLIITRRKPSALVSDIRGFQERCCLSLKCFEIAEARKFLFLRIGIGDEVDNAAAEKLIKQLGRLPLALEQAGAYINSLPCTISEYSKLYDEHRLRVFNRQKATPVSEYDSIERLAVCTTWHLNFENIKQTVDLGDAASTFLYASAFLDPNEIQKDIINIGEPPIEDEKYSKYVREDIGRREILKVLTKFSLFKENSHSLSIHHLVQEAIREDLNRHLSDKSQSVIDAIRMLHHAFRKCSSPDELLIPVSDEGRERPSIASCINPSRFYQWHKLCSHSHELVKHLKSIVKNPDVNCRKIFVPETARIVYECAIHLSVNSKHEEAKEMENFAKEISTISPFPHIIPLPELVRRHIQYSCNMPATNQRDECRVQPITAKKLGELRMKGDDLFERGFYNDALRIYSLAIDACRSTPLFDATLLVDRASVNLKLQKYDEAVQDAEEYTFYSPKCCKGYAKKALALAELNDKKNARVAASTAYYCDRNIFRDCEPFKRKFNSPEEMHLFVCRDVLDFSAVLKKVKGVAMDGIVPDRTGDLPVIVLEPGNYEISLRTIDSYLFSDNNKEFIIGSCILRGEGGDCLVTFDDSLHLKYGNDFSAHNINFRFAECSVPDSAVVKFSRCSFQGSGLRVEGQLKVDSCKFHNCPNSGLLVLGIVDVKNSEFYKNGKGGIEVQKGGRLTVQRTKLLANEHGLLIGPIAKKCVVEASEVYDNKSDGVVVDNSVSDITIKRNCIYDNEGLGICVKNSSSVSILENEISGNNKCGICVRSYSDAVVRKNEIHRNQCGGICLDAKDIVVEDNHISHNLGDGICHGELPTKQRGNNIHDNRAKGNQFTAESEIKLCHYCKKPGIYLEKCEKCFTAQYCGERCKERDCKNHVEICNRLLSESSTVLSYTPDGECLTLDSEDCSQPNTSRFIVKISMQRDPSVVRLCDSIGKINGILTGADQISSLIRRHGTVGRASHASKELFMWVKRLTNGTVCVFTNMFPPSQSW